MSQLPPDDTPPDIEAVLIDGYRRMSGDEKVARVRELNRTLQRLQLAEIRGRYPDADEHELMMRLGSRWLPPEIMLRVSGRRRLAHARAGERA